MTEEKEQESCWQKLQMLLKASAESWHTPCPLTFIAQSPSMVKPRIKWAGTHPPSPTEATERHTATGRNWSSSHIEGGINYFRTIIQLTIPLDSTHVTYIQYRDFLPMSTKKKCDRIFFFFFCPLRIVIKPCATFAKSFFRILLSPEMLTVVKQLKRIPWSNKFGKCSMLIALS